MSVDFESVEKDDVLEAKFYCESVDEQIRVAVDVNSSYVDSNDNEYKVIFGEVLLVKSMPFDALEGVEIKIELKDNKVYKRDRYGVLVGEDVELLSI